MTPQCLRVRVSEYPVVAQRRRRTSLSVMGDELSQNSNEKDNCVARRWYSKVGHKEFEYLGQILTSTFYFYFFRMDPKAFL